MKSRKPFIFGSLIVLCWAQPALSVNAPPDAGPADFQRNVVAGTATLDAISRLIAANQARREPVVIAADPYRHAFDDVANTDSAYMSMTTLEQHNLLLGYPAGYFRGKRILTRYEFAVALHRTLGLLQSPGILTPELSQLPAPPQPSEAPAPQFQTPLSNQARADLLIVSKLIQQFDPELRALGLNVREVRKRLDARLNKDGRLEK
jgi:hypothetical protein